MIDQQLSLAGRAWKRRGAARPLGPSPSLRDRCLAARPPGPPIEAWLQPALDHITSLNPFDMKGMDIAAPRLAQAARDGERILVVTDYDVDGTTSSLILQHALRLTGGPKADLQWHIPDRFEEGYGFSMRAVERAAASGVRLIVTADIGVRDHATVEAARERGIDVIICDHHLPDGESVPTAATAVLCPPQAGCAYPNKALAACGVSLKVAQALLRGHPRAEALLHSFLKLAAIGTVADLVPLTTLENRAIVALGLRALSQGPNQPGLQALLDTSGIKPGEPIEAWQLGFYVGPRINAAGRLDSAGLVVELLNQRDPELARQGAARLSELNRDRQALQAEAEAEALAAVPSPLPAFVVVSGEEDRTGVASPWHRGVVGIVAGRLKEQLNRPVAVVALSGDRGRGSVRSIPGVHAVQALEHARDLLVRFGGHPFAAGFEVRRADLPALAARLDAWTAGLDEGALFIPEDDVDDEISIRELSVPAVEGLAALGPFGKGYEEPQFVLRGVRAQDVRTMGADGQHLRFTLGPHKAVWFRAPPEAQAALAEEVDLLVTLQVESWQGRRGVTAKVKDLRFAT